MKSDPEYYRYRPYNRRQRIVGPGGAHIAVWVVPNIEFYEFNPPPSEGETIASLKGLGGPVAL